MSHSSSSSSSSSWVQVSAPVLLLLVDLLALQDLPTPAQVLTAAMQLLGALASLAQLRLWVLHS
jgi:hypothetical protein